MRTKHYTHPFLEDGPGVAPEEVGPIGPIPPEKFTLKPKRVDLNILKIGSSGAALDSFLDAQLSFERDRVWTLRDPTTDGLQIRLGRHRATWLFYWDDRRHQRRRITSKRLGFFPTMRTEEARDAARIERGRVAAGEIGPGKREAIKVETSLAEYAAYLESKSAAKGKPATWAKNVRHLVKKHIGPRWGTWSLADIAMHPGAVADWHRDITEANGPVTANKCCKVLRAAYKRSAKRDVSLPQRDPSSAVDFNIETSAQTALAFRDYPKWLEAWRAIEVGPKAPARKEYHLFGLFTGMRPGEVARIRWRDVKPRERVIEIPDAKKDNTIRIIMSAPIARVLKRARDLDKPKDRDAFVFQHCGHAGHRDNLPRRGHDLRHSYKTVCVNLGIDDVIAHVLQGWRPRNISEKYLTRLVLAAGEGIRASQRRMSAKIIQLLGADPTR
jgi:integrase